MAPLLLLLLLLLLGLAPGLARPLEPCPGPCRCRGPRLDCSGAALARVPPATRRRPFSVLDFSGNALALIRQQAWKGYPWAEKLVLQHNSLMAVKRRSLEGLLLLRHLDLSYNKIQVIEERAFENLPFLETLNLEGNLITEIRSNTFQAWHGMQFLQTLVLSHNPLSVIEDTWFFKLPLLTHLDLGATRVTRQTLLVLLLRTSRLETLKLSNDTACCLCQHKHSTETPCRTLRFDCASVCSTTAPRCAPLAETPGLLTGAVPPRKGNSNSMLKIQPKEPSLREQRIVTLTVVLSSPDASAPSPQQLSRQESNTTKELALMLQHVQHRGWSSFIDTRKLSFLAEGLVAQLKTKLSKAMSILTLKSPSTAQLVQSHKGQEVPAGRGGRATGWEQHEPNLDLIQAESTLWEAARRVDVSEILPASGHQRATTPPVAQLPTPNSTEALHLAQSGWSHRHSNALQQTNTADGMEDEEEAEVQEEAPAPAPGSAVTSKEQKLQDSERTVGSKGAEELLAAAEGETEQRLSTVQRFFYALLADNGTPAASSAPEATAAAERSSRGGSPPSAPASTTTRAQHKEQEPPVPTARGSSSTLGSTATRGAPFDSLLSHHLHWLVPDQALQRFTARVAQAVREDCGLPQLQLACTSMVLRTGLFLKLLSKRQHDPEPSELLEQCLREEDAGTSHPRAQAKEMDRESAETAWESGALLRVCAWTVGMEGASSSSALQPDQDMAKHISCHRLLLVLLLSTVITFITSIALLVLCCFKVCARKHAKDSQGSSRWCLQLRRRFQDLRPKWYRRRKDTDRDEDEPSPESLKLEPQWLQYVYQPLDACQEASLTQLYDGGCSEEEDISEERGIAWLSIGSQLVAASGDSRLMGGTLALST